MTGDLWPGAQQTRDHQSLAVRVVDTVFGQMAEDLTHTPDYQTSFPALAQQPAADQATLDQYYSEMGAVTDYETREDE
jgi:hypothetical protein